MTIFQSAPSSRSLLAPLLLIGLILASAGGLWLWGGSSADAQVTRDEVGDNVETLPKGRLPVFARSGTQDHTDLYRYAVEHGEELKYIPCYCGCGNIGHASNRACYIKREHPDGGKTFTSHAAT